MTRLPNILPGDVLREDLLVPLGMTPYRLAKRLGVPQTRIADILAGRRSVTPDTALRLAALLGTSAQFWLNLQAAYDLEEARKNAENILGKVLKNEQNPKGEMVKRVLVADAADIEKEYYLGATVDRGSKAIVVMGSAEGGVEIEQTAKEKPVEKRLNGSVTTRLSISQ